MAVSVKTYTKLSEFNLRHNPSIKMIILPVLLGILAISELALCKPKMSPYAEYASQHNSEEEISKYTEAEPESEPVTEPNENPNSETVDSKDTTAVHPISDSEEQQLNQLTKRSSQKQQIKSESHCLRGAVPEGRKDYLIAAEDIVFRSLFCSRPSRFGQRRVQRDLRNEENNDDDPVPAENIVFRPLFRTQGNPFNNRRFRRSLESGNNVFEDHRARRSILQDSRRKETVLKRGI